jgi:hypothetical protein
MARLTRRELVLGAAATSAALYLRAPGWQTIAAPDAGWDDAAYWAFADRMQALLEPSWRPDRRGYFPATRLGETSYNANLLYTHAAAARGGHTGPCRLDARTHTLVERLCESPPWRATGPAGEQGCPSAQPGATAAGDQTHACGWGDNLDSTVRQHVVVDTAVVRGLAEAVLRAGPPRRHGRPEPRPAHPAARLGRPRPVRLLDTRRLSQLGHRLRLRPLASSQEAAAVSAVPAGDRAEPALSARARGRRLPGRARLLAANPQSTDPLAGPTLALELLRGERLRTLRLSAVIAPARNLAEATAAAARLLAHRAQ